MPMVQAAILRAVSGLDDSLGFSTLVPDVRTVGLCDRKDASSVQASTIPKCIPLATCFRASGRSEAKDERRPKFKGTMARSIQMMENVSFCNISAPCKSGRWLLIDGSVRGMQ
jgi:hypothetical protein